MPLPVLRKFLEQSRVRTSVDISQRTQEWQLKMTQNRLGKRATWVCVTGGIAAFPTFLQSCSIQYHAIVKHTSHIATSSLKWILKLVRGFQYLLRYV